jgi:vacuolar-type H+-ATPase subunit I/STV1
MEQELVKRALKLYENLGEIPALVERETDNISEFEYKRILKLIDETHEESEKLQLGEAYNTEERLKMASGYLDKAEANIAEIRKICNKSNGGDEV